MCSAVRQGGSMPASSIADDCAHEAIQLLGTIQPHGFLLECSPDWIVTRASTNIRSFLPVEHEELLGRSLVEIVGQRLIHDLRGRYAIAIVTHNMQQAARVSQRTAFFHLGTLVEYGKTTDIFTNPKQERTKDYITGRYG